MRRTGIRIIPHNDIGLDADGNLAMVFDAEAVGQHARQRLSFYKGEYPLDTNVGVDWFGEVFGRVASRVGYVEALVKKIVMETPGVTGISEILTEFDRANRGAMVRKCVVETEYDEAISI